MYLNFKKFGFYLCTGVEVDVASTYVSTRGDMCAQDCWDLKLEKLSKSLSKIMIAAEGVESKHSTSWKHHEWMISSSILGDHII